MSYSGRVTLFGWRINSGRNCRKLWSLAEARGIPRFVVINRLDRDGAAPRRIVLTGAVLTAVELTYEQSSMATATLRFVAEATDGQQEPFLAEDVS